MSFLELQDLRMVYPGGMVAVECTTLAIEKGEFVVLLGPSGCGKTTTLRMIAGLEVPTGGQIRLDGQDITRRPPSQRDVGFVFQFYALYPHLTVRENILFPLRAVCTPKGEQAAMLDRVITRLGIAPLLDRLPPQLSGGDQQRVAVARAMVRRPRIYLMDEPLGTLDTDHRCALREFIREQHQAQRVTTVYVTHDQEEAMTLADRIVVMHAGLVRQVGSPGAIYDTPAEQFVGAFVGSPGMNFLHGAITRIDGRTHFQPSGISMAIPLEIASASGPVLLGIRPEHVQLDPAGPLTGTVATNEYVGSHRFLHLDSAAGRLAMHVSADFNPRPGNPVRIRFDANSIHRFDPETGRRLQ